MILQDYRSRRGHSGSVPFFTGIRFFIGLWPKHSRNRIIVPMSYITFLKKMKSGQGLKRRPKGQGLKRPAQGPRAQEAGPRAKGSRGWPKGQGLKRPAQGPRAQGAGPRAKGSRGWPKGQDHPPGVPGYFSPPHPPRPPPGIPPGYPPRVPPPGHSG